MKRVLIIANKWYECGPHVNVLPNTGECPSAPGWPQYLTTHILRIYDALAEAQRTG